MPMLAQQAFDLLSYLLAHELVLTEEHERLFTELSPSD